MPESKIKNTDDTKRGLIPSVFKKIDQSDVKINPFLTHKKFTAISGSNTASLLPLQAEYIDINNLPALGSELTFNDNKNIDGSLHSVTYFSVNHLFYKRKNQPYNSFGPSDLSKTNKFLYKNASIFSIPQLKIGEKIKSTTFNITSSNIAVYGSAVYGSAVYGGSGNTLFISSDKHGNLINNNFPTQSIVTDVRYYEGFNEYFDVSRILYTSENVSYINGVTTTSGASKSYGLAANFKGNGYIQTDINGSYDRYNNYSVSLFVSASNPHTDNKVIITKSSKSTDIKYPFKFELSNTNKIIFSVAGSSNLKRELTSSSTISNWTHVVGQKTGNTIELYINGLLEASASSAALAPSNNPSVLTERIDNNSPIHIGGYSDSNYLSGSIDEIRIFNKSLNNTQILNLGDRHESGSFLQTQYIGNIFEKQGIAVISSPDYRFDDIIKNSYTASYRSTKTIHELNVITRIDSGDFNMSTNLTLTKDDDKSYVPFVTGSNFSPYITSIGLYNDAGQLLAIAKPAQAIKKRPDVDMNFVIQIDLDKNITLKE